MTLPPADDVVAREPADLEALDTDGIVVVSLGTVVWAVALVLTLVFESSLRRHGHLWWIAAAACGTGLGLLGVCYCVRRRSRLRQVVESGVEQETR